MNLLEIYLAISTAVLAFAWFCEIKNTNRQSAQFAKLHEEHVKLIRAIRAADGIASESKFVTLYP